METRPGILGRNRFHNPARRRSPQEVRIPKTAGEIGHPIGLSSKLRVGLFRIKTEREKLHLGKNNTASMFPSFFPASTRLKKSTIDGEIPTSRSKANLAILSHNHSMTLLLMDVQTSISWYVTFLTSIQWFKVRHPKTFTILPRKIQVCHQSSIKHLDRGKNIGRKPVQK